MIQTHLIICENWATVKDKAKSLEHIRKCNPPSPAMPLVTMGATVPGLYSHIAHSVDKEEEEMPPPFKGAKLKQIRGRGKQKGNLRVLDRTHLEPKRQRKPMVMIVLITITTMIITLPQVQTKAADLLMVKVVTGNLEASHIEAEAKDLSITNANFKIIDPREAHLNITVNRNQYCTHCKPYFQGNQTSH